MESFTAAVTQMELLSCMNGLAFWQGKYIFKMAKTFAYSYEYFHCGDRTEKREHLRHQKERNICNAHSMEVISRRLIWLCGGNKVPLHHCCGETWGFVSRLVIHFFLKKEKRKIGRKIARVRSLSVFLNCC